MSRNSSDAPRVRGGLLRKIPHRQVLIGLGVLAAFDLLFWAFAVRPTAQREADQRTRVQILERQIEEKSAAVEQLREAARRVGSARGEGDKLTAELTFERRTTFSNLMRELGEDASQAQVEVREVSFNSDEIAGNADYGMVSINANFRGQYANLVRFLNMLDRSERFLIIERLGAFPREDTGDLQITMRIDTFMRDLDMSEPPSNAPNDEPTDPPNEEPSDGANAEVAQQL